MRPIAVFHEVGHFLDYSGAGGGTGYASATSSTFAAWLMSVVASAPFARLSETIVRGLASIPFDDSVGRRRLAGLRRPEELWARSYAQFIVGRSGRVDFARSIAALRLGEIAGITVPLQWEEDEFDAIDREIELLMRSMGWRNKRRESGAGRGQPQS